MSQQICHEPHVQSSPHFLFVLPITVVFAVCRCRQWVINCRTKSLDSKSVAELHKNFRLCSLHFEHTQFMNSSKPKLGLLHSAVPTIFNVPNPPRKITCQRRLISRSRTAAAKTSSVPTSSVSADHAYCTARHNTPSTNSPLKQQLRHKLDLTRKKLRQARVLLSRTRVSKRPAIAKVCEKCKNFDKLPRGQKAFFQMQLAAVNVRKRGMRYSKYNKMLCLGLFYRSPAAYRFLSRTFCLPSTSTLRKFISVMDVHPGFDTDFVRALQCRAKSLTALDKHVILMFDGMSLRSSLKYDSQTDRVHGFVDMRGFTPPSTSVAKSAVQFLVRGLCTRWKHPLGYFFIGNSVPACVLQKMIKDAINILQSMDFHVVAVVCDQESGHRVCYRDMGVTSQKPWITVSSSGDFFGLGFSCYVQVSCCHIQFVTQFLLKRTSCEVMCFV